MAKELDFYLYEVLDRACILECHFDDALVDHPAVNNDAELKKLVTKAHHAILDIYQYAGAQWHKKNPELFANQMGEDDA